MAMRLGRPFQNRFTINYFRKVFTEFPETGNIRTLIDSKATVVFYHSLKASCSNILTPLKFVISYLGLFHTWGHFIFRVTSYFGPLHTMSHFIPYVTSYLDYFIPRGTSYQSLHPKCTSCQVTLHPVALATSHFISSHTI